MKDLFEITGSGQNIKVFKAAPGHVQTSVSSAVPQERSERAPRTIETPGTRAAYRRWHDDLKIKYVGNPARRGSERWTRYEKYKTATTVGEAKRLGSTSQDFSLDEKAYEITNDGVAKKGLQIL